MVHLAEYESRKALLGERIANCGRPLPDYDETFRTAMEFLANPYKLWVSDRLEDRRAVLKLVFADRLAYAKDEGFRTAETSLPFKALEGFSGSKKEMVPLVGLEPTHLAVLDFESSASTISPQGHDLQLFSIAEPCFPCKIASGPKKALSKAEQGIIQKTDIWGFGNSSVQELGKRLTSVW